MKFVRASHCVCPILGLSSSGSVLLVQTKHPDPSGTSRHIRETQSNKTELLSNTHVLTSSALPYGSVIKPWREVFLSMCVCLCVPMSSQEHKQTQRRDMLTTTNRNVILLMKYKQRTWICVLPHTQVQSLCLYSRKVWVYKLQQTPSVRSTKSLTELAHGSRKCNFFLSYQIIYLKSTLKCNLHIQCLEYIYSMIGTFFSVIKWIYLFCWGGGVTLIKSEL